MTQGDFSVRLVTSGRECRVGRLLGEGGEGQVFEATLPGDDGAYALKWYHAEQATAARRAALTKLIDTGAPANGFLWPIELADRPGTTGFGYLMPRRENRFYGLGDYLARRITAELRELALAAIQLADGFLQLHARGLCYRDISYGNVFFDPDTGDVLICDNDNVGIDGEQTLVMGTPYFMAPEIVRREAMPSANTDRFSLAVLLFYLFMLDHPLLGEAETDEPALVQLFGFRPRFIFDPEDPSNRPVDGVHRNALLYWPLYPSSIRALFTRSFTAGLGDPLNGRVRESEWRRAFARLHDSIVPCRACGTQNLYDPTREGPWTCCDPACGRPLTVPLRLVVGDHQVVLAGGTRIYPHHLGGRLYDFSVPAAHVVEHRTYDLTGLTNASQSTWTVSTADGRTANVPPSQTVSAADGVQIDFGRVVGRITGGRSG